MFRSLAVIPDQLLWDRPAIFAAIGGQVIHWICCGATALSSVPEN